MSLLISIIVPCYNQVEYLDECLQSVLDQTYQNWECIIVNDGSPDNTEEVAQKWIERDKRFSLLNLENGGVSRARNKGIEAANGEWILPLDGDDKIAKDYLKFASIYLREEKEYIVYCDGSYFGEKSGPINIPPYDERLMLRKNLIFCSGFFQKKTWFKIGGYDTHMKYGLEDWEFWINLLKNTKQKPRKIDYPGFYYRIKSVSRNSSMTEGKDSIMINYIIEKHKDHYEKMFGNYYTVINRAENLQEKVNWLRSHQSGIFPFLKRIIKFKK